MELKNFISILLLNVHTFVVVINAKNIKGPPIIKEHPKSIVARRNHPVTLKCAVSGAQDIRWFREGQRVISTKQVAGSHRMILPDGSLFFLRVTNNKRDGDTGVYWCVASNRRGKVRSRNATLSIAFLDEFELRQESVITATIGAKTMLKCAAPNGLPSPRLRWKHFNSLVEYDHRRYPNAVGDLIFERVTETDVGRYFCEASNLAGNQKSPIITLEIKERNQKKLKTKFANINENVVLPCNSYDNLYPNVTWKKKGGKIPIDRSKIVKKHTLHISNLAFSDSGEYFCESVGHLGKNMATVILKVFQKPEIVHRSPGQLVFDGASFTVFCNITGNPKPLLVWKLPTYNKTPSYLLSGQSIADVSSNSSHLTVKNADRSNNGNYICWGINSSWAVAAKSVVTILKTFPPPLMGTKPQDLKRKEGSTATFPCEAASEYLTANITWWYRNFSVPVDVKVQQSIFISILPIGALVIKNVSVTDAGIYTCEVASEAGNVKEEATLIIDNLVIGSHPARYVPRPAPPSKPIATSISDSTIDLSWMPNSKRSRGEDVTYSVQMWRSPWPRWKTVLTNATKEFTHITGLNPNQSYLFIVKTINKYGFESFPSPWSDIITTTNGEVVDLEEETFLRQILDKVHVNLSEGKEIRKNNVDLSWQLNADLEKQINTFAIYLVQGADISRFVVFGSSSSYRLTNLKSNSSLTIFITPIIGNHEGKPSNSILVQTEHSKGTQMSPQNLKATDFASGFVITWENPNESQVPIAYKILVTFNGTTTYYSTNETAIKLNPKSSKFSVKIAAVTQTGIGPWSESKDFHAKECCEDGETLPSVLYSPFHPAWFLYLLIPTGLFIILLSVLYLRYVRQKTAPPSATQLSAPVYYSDSTAFNQRGQMNIYDGEKAWRPEPKLMSLTKASPIVAEYAEPRCRYDDPEPYATTALLSPHSIHTPAHYQCRDYPPGNELRVNWSTLLPPPPQEPPPVELTGWNSLEECDHCCNQDLHVYQHPCNAISSSQQPCMVPKADFARFTSLQIPNKQESFILETKSSTH